MAKTLRVIMTEDEYRQARDDMRLLGGAWVYVAPDRIGIRIEPSRVMLKPLPSATPQEH